MYLYTRKVKKALYHIGIILLLLLSQSIGAVKLTSMDPYWIGSESTFGTTQGNDYWVTFMPNITKEPNDKSLNLRIYAVAAKGMTIKIENGSKEPLGEIVIPGGGGAKFSEPLDPMKVYFGPNEASQKANRGVHIYSTDPDATFSCFALSEAGEEGSSSRDLALLIPTEYLAQEYYIQTFPDDAESTEFAIVATEENTKITIQQKTWDANGQPGYTPITATLENKGDVYLVRYKKTPNQKIDLSGSTVCADKPVAVFQGNESVKIATGSSTGSYSANHLFEQAGTKSTWGTEFHFGLTAHAKSNFFYVTATENGTNITILRQGQQVKSDSYSLSAGQSIANALYLLDPYYTDVTITSDKPILCSSYLSCGGANSESIFDPNTGIETTYTWGNPTSAMIPDWNLRTTEMSFYADLIDNESSEGVGHMYVQIVTKADEKSLITLDGLPITGDPFRMMNSASDMAVANIEITSVGNHTLRSTGEGFVGFVYSITSEARAFQYTLGYNINPYRDSMFVSNAEEIQMSRHSYDLPKTDHGWYQRQLNEWKSGHERLDTAWICDNTEVKWAIKISDQNPISNIEWFAYDVTGGKEPTDKNKKKGWPSKGSNNTASQRFKLDPELDLEPGERTPYKDYEIQALLHRTHEICTDLAEDIDTMRTTVRVSRQYKDTTYRIICIGDTIKFFYDSLPNQMSEGAGTILEDDPAIRTTMADSTMFIGDPTSKDFEWQVNLGENIFTRKYTTAYGCDSLSTLFLFVCDTFRFVESRDLVSNDKLTYHEKRYVGDEYYDSHPDDVKPKDIIIHNDTVVFVEFKTKNCGCQQNPKYPYFQGCDSIYELHISYHNTFFQADTIQLCDNHSETLFPKGRPDRSYPFYGFKKEGTPPSGSIVLKKDTIITDSLLTQAIPQRDSVYWAYAFLNPTYEFFDTLHVCDNKSVTWNVTPARTYNGADYTAEMTFEDRWSGTTVNCGCDSIRHLKLWVHKSYFFSESAEECQDVNNTKYVWDKHENRKLYDKKNNKWIQASSINLKVAGEYIYIDSLLTKGCPQCGTKHGCDSVFELHLTVKPSYTHLQTTKATTCQNEPYTWREHTYSNLHVGDHTFTEKFTTKGGCDSTFTLYLHVDTAYTKFVKITNRHICDKDTLHFYDKIYRGSKAAYTGGNQILIPDGKSSASTTDSHTDKTVNGCDSVVCHRIYVHRTYEFTETKRVCQGDPFIWTDHTDRQLWDVQQQKWIDANTIPTDMAHDANYYFIDSLKTKNCPVCRPDGSCGCDSVWILELYIPPAYRYPETHHLCAHDTMSWQGMLLVGSQFEKYGGTYDPTKYDSILIGYAGKHHRTIIYPTMDGCDSVFTLDLTVDSLYRETMPVRQCQSPGGTYYYKYLNNGAGGDLPAEHLSQSLTRIDTIRNQQNGCDSLIVQLEFHVDSAYYYYQDLPPVPQKKDSLWEWKNEFGDVMNKISLDEGDKHIHMDINPGTIHNCDSMFSMDLYIAPTYYIEEPLTICENDSVSWQHIMFTGREFAAYNPGGYDPTPYTKTRDHLTAGIYYDTVKYTTATYGFDSIYYLTLTVHPVKRVQDTIRVCQEPGGTYFYPFLNNGAGGYLPAEHLSDSLKRLDTLQTQFGCDSLVGLVYFVDSVYHFYQTDSVCQDTVNTAWPWIDKRFGESHGFIDISDSGDFVYEEKHQTIHKCDSVFHINLRVRPIYRFDSIYSICDNERVSWQGKSFCGDKYKSPLPGDIIVKAGLLSQDTIYRDTVRYDTYEGCEKDSTFILALHVHPTFAHTVRIHVCDNEDKHTYTFSDTQGNSFTHFIPFKPTYPEVWDTEGVVKPNKDTIITDTLQTIYGCDSLVTLHLTIHPSYFYELDEKVCFTKNTTVWHGKTISSSGIYYDSLTTVYGCDSVYRLEYYVKPYLTVPIYDKVCNNHVYFHYDTLYHADGTIRINQDTVWHPGSLLPDPVKRPYIEVKYYGADGCDSVAFQYHLTVCPTYDFSDQTGTICSGDTVYSETLGHAWADWAIEYDVDTFVQPYDTVFIDSLQTVMGCDSVYNLQVHVNPAYRHIDYDTICANDSVKWRDTLIVRPKAGLHFIRDSFLTVNQCDSIYELQLWVYADFYNEEHTTLCADDSIEWHNLHISGLKPREEEYLFFDSLQTKLGCDSVYHLYVLALDTTMEVHYDTICYNDTIHVLDHIYSVAGDYKDTTLNDDGCHHFIYTHLAVIPPTVPTVWADSLCSQTDAFELHYTYTSHYPLSYSLYFDSAGYAMGFDSLVDVPITEYTDPMVITVPMPLRQGDRNQYPRPDTYHFTLILDNGFCQRPKEDCTNDSTFTTSYPSWIIEQHYNDVIALLDSAHNGGYTFTAYQWYQGDSILLGQTKPYLHIPTGLELGESYYVRLTRQGDSIEYNTCPITIESYAQDPYAPKMGYLSVTPTCVTLGHPYVNILSHSPTNDASGMYRITTTNGHLVGEGEFHADVTTVELPTVEGMYIFQLWAKDLPEEPYRAIKVFVRSLCPNCDISSF